MSDRLETLTRLAHELRTQDNLCTAHPMYVVQRLETDVGYDTDYTDKIGWTDSETLVTTKSDPERFTRFEAGNFSEDDDGDAEQWTRTGYVERWEFLQPFFAKSAAEEFIARNGHRFGTMRMYVESGHRNQEWQLLREMLRGPLAEEITLLRERNAALHLRVHEAEKRVGSLTFAEFSSQNAARCRESFYPLEQRSFSDWITCVTEELGEVAQLVKRVFDGRMTIDDARPKLGDEIADTVSYLDLLATSLGSELGTALVKKWNIVSERIDNPRRL